MRGEIITIGDELISGRIRDANSYFLSGRLSSYGFEIKAISSVGDDEEYILEVLDRAVKRSDFIVVTGGLGPTEDDMTAEIAGRFFHRPLVLDERLLGRMKTMMKDRGIPWLESYRKFGQSPQGATAIDPEGDACGFFLNFERGETSVPIFFLPGVPREVRQLAENKVLPHLLRHSPEKAFVRQRLFKTFGIMEAEINRALEGLENKAGGIRIGYYPNFPENHVTVTVRAGSARAANEVLTQMDAEIQDRIGKFIMAMDDDSLDEAVNRLFIEHGLTVSVAESCTGGLIARRLTSVSGSSDYFERGVVSYSNQAKQELLGVPWDIINKHGAVSAQTAERMAAGIRDSSRTDIGLASTGIAGPTGGTLEKPVGTVFLALSTLDGDWSRRYQFSGNREQITVLTAQTALSLLKRYLTDDTFLFRN